MSETAAAPDPQQKARRLWRWTWGMVALAFAVIAGTAAVFDIAPPSISEAVEKVGMAALFLGIASYLVLRGEPAWRNARSNWVAALVFLLGIAPAMFVAQRLEQRQEVEKILAISNSMAGLYVKADQDYAEKIRPQLEAALPALGTASIADAAARNTARVALAAAVKTMDEALARRDRIPEETIARIRATAAGKESKESAVAAIRAAVAGPQPLAVQMIKGTRAVVLKAGEVLAHVNQYAADITVRDGQIEFADTAVGDIYIALRAEMTALLEELKRLSAQAKAK